MVIYNSHIVYFQTRSYIHVFEQCTQNWFSVASILEHTLATLKSIKPSLEEAFLRCSDNAGCYHCAYMILSLPSLGERVGIKLTRFDFSDPQAGKDICDRRIAATKSHMRRFLNEGNDIQTASDMKTAIESYGGVKGCYTAVAQIQVSSQTMLQHTMSGVQSLNNFSFESAGTRSWKAYNVGPGKLFSKTQLLKYGVLQGPTNMMIVEPFSQPHQQVGSFTRSTTVQSQQPIAPEQQPQAQEEDIESVHARFSCPEEGCIKTYQSFRNLQKHLDVGKHLVKLERESTYDEIRMKWAETCKTVSGPYLQNVPSTSATSSDDVTPVLQQGWALKKTRRSTHFSTAVKSYLTDIFFHGEDTGIKANASDIASKMKRERSASGEKTFQKEEWLTSDQVARYFSRLSALNKSGKLRRKEVTEVPTEEEDEYTEVTTFETNRMKTRLQIRRELEL